MFPANKNAKEPAWSA